MQWSLPISTLTYFTCIRFCGREYSQPVKFVHPFSERDMADSQLGNRGVITCGWSAIIPVSECVGPLAYAKVPYVWSMPRILY